MSQQLEAQVITLAAEFLKADPARFTLESSVGDLPQWDSFAHANMLLEVERRFQVAFEIEDVLDMQTLHDIFSALLRRGAVGLLA